MNKRLFLLDIDGTICRGNALIPGAGDFLQAIRRSGGQYVFITNNSTRSTQDYIRFFRTLGVPSDEHNYLTAGTTTIRYLQEHYAGQHIYALATDSFLKECRHSGLQITTNARDKTITCVLVSYDSALTYEKIKDVCLLLTTRRVDYIATNPDLVCPVDFGYLPDCGAICNMIETATHRRPKFLGKPEPAMVQYALQAAGCAPRGGSGGGRPPVHRHCLRSAGRGGHRPGAQRRGHHGRRAGQHRQAHLDFSLGGGAAAGLSAGCRPRAGAFHHAPCPSCRQRMTGL